MAHIQKTDKGYRVFVETGTGYNRKRRTKLFQSKEAAEDWMSRMVVDRNDGLMTRPEKITFQKFAYRWLKNKKPTIAETTYKGYKEKLEGYIIPYFYDVLVKDITPFHIEDYLDYLRTSGRKKGEGGLSENTLKKHYVTLNGIFKYAMKPGINIVKVNPVQAVTSPKPEKREMKVLNKKQYMTLLDTAKEDSLMFTLIATILFTGLRRSEAIGLEWEDIDDGVINVSKRYVRTSEGYKHEVGTKNKSSRRTVKISNNLIKILRRYEKQQKELKLLFGPKYNSKKDYVFCKPDGYQYTLKNYNRRFKKIAKEANLDGFTLHSLRHTFATINLENDIPAKIVQEMLGHSTITTTLDTYSHVNISMQEKATDKLDEAINID